ncbi:hypothetical protein AAG570_008082 [Ranatra chinensis]|uniref:Uncharacterized protein n=1 Tax=Ranatra chinensis TaxID=642074 RepID=A0ABD0YCA7_9HEMI
MYLTETTFVLAVDDRKLSERIREVLAHYKEHGVVRISGVDLPDPMAVPDVKRNFAGTPMNFTNVQVYGLSNFTVDHVNTDLDNMQLFVALKMERLVILGNYSVKSWLTRSAGPFNITLIDVEATGAAELNRDEEGKLGASDHRLDMAFRDAKVDFHNFGLVGTFLQGVVASAGPVIFEAVKPSIIAQVDERVGKDLDKKLKILGEKFSSPDADRPLDRAVIEGRKYVRINGYDPYHLKDYVLQEGIVKIEISRLWTAGLSHFYRVGDVSLSMDSGTIQLGVTLATGLLTGNCVWKVTIGEYKKTGDTNFTVSHLQVKAVVNQSLDVSQHPVLDDLDLHIGRLQVQMDRAEKMDLMIEFFINTLPDLLKHIIVDAIEQPIKAKAQEILNKIDVEEMVDKNLPEVDNIVL